MIHAEELFQALDDSVQTFHLTGQQENKLHQLLCSYCTNAPKSINLTLQTCLNAFNQALYLTLRTIITGINADTQFAWRCFTNDLSTPDILAAYEIKRRSRELIEILFEEIFVIGMTSANRNSARTIGNSAGISSTKRSGGGKEKNSEDRINSKQQSALTPSLSIPDLQGYF